MADPTAAFTKLVPGFDFLQGLVKNAGAALPSVGQWVAPTLNPEELEKRIEELRTVQFWLEQNARMLGATIQALEVQRMTLSTLKTMNLSFSDLTESLKIRMPEPAEAPAPQATASEPAPAPAPKAAAPGKAGAADKAAEVPTGVVDPMQWWGALTKQFTELAANAMKDTATDAAKNLAGAMVKQSFDAAGETLKKAASMPAAVAKSAASAAQKAASVAQAAASGGLAPLSPNGAAGKSGAARKAAAKRTPSRK
ncbi:PhaM family polyhydroxyalkanoate granule multifunctional regulatory protein [Aquabacterium sp.]|uniref:PhaM family polyhydroxyalkanoate granule multifunctional regulatory protein n=1 Tax=Aquabacterium sp. TaxID=1872578 RepID=UPI002C213CC9|nr:PhaM family polyhydroxyalkanoate granule multifunctional regulatory protein [Aquabacterium sp.]HSW03346.1 PhaM family polyhydroxyalkanoate granule multifunctional regulatory protein [Aquabacterium sp.]